MPEEKKYEKETVKEAIQEGDEPFLANYTKQLEKNIRILKAEKQLIESEKIRLDHEVRSIKNELDRMRQPPLVTAIVDKILEDGRIQVRSSTGPRFIVKHTAKISPINLKPGMIVALNQRTFSIVEIISELKEVEYSAAHAWLGLPQEIKIIEVQDWDEITPNLKNYFSIRLKNLEQLKEIATIYRIPVIFNKNEKYVAIYYDTPLFWVEP